MTRGLVASRRRSRARCGARPSACGRGTGRPTRGCSWSRRRPLGARVRGRQLERTARALGVELGPPSWVKGVAGQSIFHLSQFTLLLHDFQRRGNHLGFAWFHGRPARPGMPEFDACFETMRRRHRRSTASRSRTGRWRSSCSAPASPDGCIGSRSGSTWTRSRSERRGPLVRPSRARPPGDGVRRRLVPEGRGRLG